LDHRPAPTPLSLAPTRLLGKGHARHAQPPTGKDRQYLNLQDITLAPDTDAADQKWSIHLITAIDRYVKHRDCPPRARQLRKHKTAEVEAWPAKHPQFEPYVTPTRTSWLNLVEWFFAEIATERIRRGAFASAAELENAIHHHLDRNNADSGRFVWAKSADGILAGGAALSTSSTLLRRGSKR
jgi:hypothetical protein